MDLTKIKKDHKAKSNKVKRLNKKLKRLKSRIKDDYIYKLELEKVLRNRSQEYREYYNKYDHPTDYQWAFVEGKASILKDMADCLLKNKDIDDLKYI